MKSLFAFLSGNPKNKHHPPINSAQQQQRTPIGTPIDPTPPSAAHLIGLPARLSYLNTSFVPHLLPSANTGESSNSSIASTSRAHLRHLEGTLATQTTLVRGLFAELDELRLLLERKSSQIEELVEGLKMSHRLQKEAYQRERESLRWCEGVQVRKGWKKGGWLGCWKRLGGRRGKGKGKGRLEGPTGGLEGAQSGGDEMAEGALDGESLSREEFEEVVKRMSKNVGELRKGVANTKRRLEGCVGIPETECEGGWA
ncbi:hypothetical protein H2201_000654 [Coniosporium apollinis]|uniref:Uncharacterized protein n=1 Tax=Coniosporium apollinis TaxID=61459 RepID=A0ABQ9P3W3_9PEZI|nr:hypothetical protein H2201_000654 [Coniosporium apollinis]